MRTPFPPGAIWTSGDACTLEIFRVHISLSLVYLQRTLLLFSIASGVAAENAAAASGPQLGS